MRQEFIKTSKRAYASKRAPWAAIIVKVSGGFHAFESVDDFRIWSNQS